MVKTTLELRDDVYKKLVEASLERYGNTKSLSKIANEMMEEHMNEKEACGEAEIKKRLEIVRKSAGIWKIKETGEEYTRRIRSESEKRMKRMGL
ncbi:MAG: hypothetical protein HYT73_00140 [Candidatus Aenigmarchaeota archaeon]|nr:hypothetical protein [Candidatus Aenigmarchaeota archaeon]